MKKLFLLFLSLALLCSSALADGPMMMTVSEFIDLYNALPAPLGAPYLPLNTPDDSGTGSVLFYADNNKDVIITLTASGNSSDLLSSDLTSVMITARPDAFPALFSVAERVVSVFYYERTFAKTIYFAMTDAITSYYESNLSSVKLFGKVCLSFTSDNAMFAFIIQ